MMVADGGGGEIKERREIVGTIRGCIKTVTCGTKLSRNDNFKALPVYTKLAYILGLRVSASHRYTISFIYHIISIYIYLLSRRIYVYPVIY